MVTEQIKWEKQETDSDFLKMDFGQEVVGIYLGKEESTRYPETYNYKFDFGKLGIKFIGGTVISGHIDDEKNPIKEGTVVKIVYHGKPKGKNYHDYDVYVGCKK